MSIQVAWDNKDKTAIRFDFDGKWNWYGYEMAVGESFGMVEGISHPVHYIFNMQRSEPLPDGATFYFKRTLELSPTGQNKIVIAYADSNAQAHVSLFCSIYTRFSRRLFAAHTIDLARTMLVERHFEAPVSTPAPVLAPALASAPAPRRTGIRLIAAS